MSPQHITPSKPEPRIPILLHLRPPINLQPRSPNLPFVTRIWSVNRVNAAQSDVRMKTNSSNVQSKSQSSVQVQVKPQPAVQKQQTQDSQIQPEGLEGSARTHHCITKPLTEPHPAPEPQTPPKHKPPPAASSSPLPKTRSQISSQPSSHRGVAQRPVKRRRGGSLEAASSAKKSSSCGLEPVVAPSNKPWPVFTIAGSAPEKTAKPPPEVHRYDTCTLVFFGSSSSILLIYYYF